MQPHGPAHGRLVHRRKEATMGKRGRKRRDRRKKNANHG
ncbi:50S ribosomal protein bL37, partial [Dietzia cinnamea]